MVVLLALLLCGCAEKTEVEKMPASNVTLINVVYDNYQYGPDTKTGWGFGCVVQANETILFDTGGDGPTLLANMEAMGISPEEIEIVVLSHIHGDHTGGLDGFLGENSNVKVYVPASFPESFKESVRARGAEVVGVTGYTKISGGVYTTGELGTSIKEQSLLVETDKGITVITGCAHPGIAHIVEKAKESSGKDIYLVMGGFHLGGESDEEIGSILSGFRGLGVKRVAPCHCTGDRAIYLFGQEYGKDFIKSGTGKIIEA